MKELEQAIYQKYIVPTKRKRTKAVGIEIELPIVNLEKKPVDFALVHEMTGAFIDRFGFTKTHRDDNGDIYSAESPETGDGLSYDCSYNTLEFSFGVEENLHIIWARFTAYYSFVQDYFRPHHHTLTGMGVNPYREYNKKEPVASERYRMLFHHLSAYPTYENAILFHTHPDFGMFSCASQVQMDVEEEMLPEVINTFSKLEPLKALLFANSTWDEVNHELLCSRDWFWKNSMHGINPHNVDMYEVEIHNAEEMCAYIASMSMYCVERDGKYINFPPIRLEEYFTSSHIEGEYFDGKEYRKAVFVPQMEDLAYLRSFKFEDLTFRGTVEFRSVCCQPVSEALTVAAFHAGLMEELPELKKLLDEDHVIYGHGYHAGELRALFNQKKLPEFVDPAQVAELLQQVLHLASDGLAKRGHGEEKFLTPLYRRAESLNSPAREMEEGIQSGRSLEGYILKYSNL